MCLKAHLFFYKKYVIILLVGDNMRELISEIIECLLKVPHMNKDILIAMINPLRSEKQLAAFLQYLTENENNLYLMRIDRLLKVRASIASND